MLTMNSENVAGILLYPFLFSKFSLDLSSDSRSFVFCYQEKKKITGMKKERYKERDL